MGFLKAELEDGDEAIIETKKAHISIKQRGDDTVIHESGKTMNTYEYAEKEK